MLKPGFHLVDWMNLMRVSSDMSGRNGGPPRKISPAELATHTSQFDCWTAYNGKVYNISQYMHYHPGGMPMLMKGAGKDCTKLFNKYHAWVNLESMMGKCYVGLLAADDGGITEGGEEEEDEEEGGKKCGENGHTAEGAGSVRRGADGDADVDELRRRARVALSLNDDDGDGDAKALAGADDAGGEGGKASKA